MSSDPAFEGCGSTVGIETWRVENLGLKKLDKGTVCNNYMSLFAMFVLFIIDLILLKIQFSPSKIFDF